MTMRGRDRDGYEDLDEYEDEYEDQDTGEDEYEEEDHQPTEQELEYLELRQKLKESIRKQMKKDPGSSLANSREKKNTMQYNNFGSFFGPSQPVIAQRVIEESKSLLENPHLAERINKSKHSNNKVHASASAGSRSQPNGHPPKMTSAIKTQSKIQMLKSTRDYSFLMSDDAELPAPKKELQTRNVPVSRPEARSVQQPPKSRELSSNYGKKVFNAREESRAMPSNRQMKPKGPHNLPSASKPVTSMDYRKEQHGSNNGTRPGRPQTAKSLPPKTLNNSVEKRIIRPSAKTSVPVVHKPLLSKSQQAVPKQTLERRRELQESSKGKLASRQPMSKPQIKQRPERGPSGVTSQQDYQKKRPARKYSDEEAEEDVQAISMIRKMFGYNPRKYADDDDVSDMEANFDDILREEQRSAKIAAQEDEEELRKIEEEERRERMRKKRKLSR